MNQEIKTPEEIKKQFRSQAYIFAASLISITLLIAAVVNWRNGFELVAWIELALALTFILTIPLAIKKIFIDGLTNLLIYLTGFALLYNSTQLSTNDPGPYIGLMALYAIAGLILEKEHHFVLYVIVMYIGFLATNNLSESSLDTTGSLKFQVVFFTLITFLFLHRNSSDKEVKHCQRQTKAANKAKESMEAHSKEAQKAKDLLESKNKELSKQKAILQEMNDKMTGRELRMIELKNEIKKLKDKLNS